MERARPDTGKKGNRWGGLIQFNRGKVHNLTTAAHLWLATLIGLACGLGKLAAGGGINLTIISAAIDCGS